MDNYSLVFFCGIGLMIVIASANDKLKKEDCESSLPAGHKCVLVAVPEANNETLNNHITDSNRANR